MSGKLMLRMLTGCRRQRMREEFLSRHISTSRTYNRHSEGNQATAWRPELYVFDKYGTLVNIHRVWTPWVMKLSQRLEAVTGLSLEEKLLSSLDICTFTKRVRAGVVGDGTTWQVKQELEKVLNQEGMSWRNAQLLVEQCWGDCSVTDTETIQQLRSAKVIFDEIKASGAKIAVCSSDLRDVTMSMLQQANLLDVIDHVVCGDSLTYAALDRTSHVAQICQDVGVDPDQTVVIGDTRGDMLMGRAGQVALSVGVLSGIGTRLDLHGLADFIADDIAGAVGRIRSVNEQQLETIKQARAEGIGEVSIKKADLVIFDKDGTLLCFHSLWTPIANTMMERLENATGIRTLGQKVLPEFGYFVKEDKWRPSVFTQGTTRQCKDRLTEILLEEGVHERDTERIISESWYSGDHSSKNVSLRPLDNPAAIFKSLKDSGIKVAVCTSDCRKGTEQFLADLGADTYVDMIVCGDDPESIPKPDAHNALYICEQLGVQPGRAVMVGDTMADMVMGRAAKLGATVAVLSGVGDIGHLAPDADHMVPSVKHVLNVVT